MKKLMSTLIIVMMVLALATSAYAMGVVGGGMNEMVIGENVAQIQVVYDAEWDEFYPMPANFQWVATEDATLTIDFSDDDEYGAYANIYVMTPEGDMGWYGIQDKGGQVSLQVVEGDTVMMEVGVMDMLTEEGIVEFHFTMSLGEALEAGASQEYPIEIEFQWNDEWTEGYATVNVPAGKTVWFASYGINNMELFVDGVYHSTMPAMDRMNWGPATFALTNDTEEDATYELTLKWPVGTDYNPDQLPINDSVVLELPADLQGGYVYGWFATEDGTLTVTVEGDFWCYTLNNWGSPDTWNDDIYGDYMTAANGDSNVVTMEVKAGDEVVLMVGSDDGNWGMPATTLTITTTLTTGGNEGGNEEPACEHGNTEFQYDEENNMYEVCLDCGEVVATYLYGCFDNPIMVDFMWNDDYTAASAIVTVPAGQTLWFGQYRIGGLTLTINGEDMGVLEDMGWYYPTMFAITNDGTEDATYELVLTYPLGSYENPYVLEELGQFVVDLELYNNGAYYKWVATADGTLTLTIEGQYWIYFVNNETEGTWGDRFYGVDGDPNTYSVEVKAGDVLLIGFGTLDENWMTPASTLVVTLELATAEEGPCKHENLVHVEAVEPGCYTEGNIEHWYCEECETVWSDEALTMITNHLSVILPATHKNIVHVEAVEPGCFNEGNIEHWYCADCDTVWSDEAMLMVTNHKSVILPATHKNIVHVEAVAPTCTENGTVEHWYCEDCLTVWIDEALLQISNMKNVVDPATGHIYVDGQCHCGAKDELPPTGDAISIFCILAAVSSMGIAILPKKKEN